jgi:uncharacterized protein YeaO (DUF488 family)
MIGLRRAYESAAKDFQGSYLVDDLWPRGLKKEEVRVESWVRAAAPSKDLRHWFNHEPARWNEFKRRYFAELDQKPEAWQQLLQAAKAHNITLVYGARDTEHNNAAALKDYLEKKMAAKPRRHSDKTAMKPKEQGQPIRTGRAIRKRTKSETE